MPNDIRQLKLTKDQKEFILKRLNAAKTVSRHELLFLFESALLKEFENEISFFPVLAFPVNFEGEFERVVINKDVRGDNLNARLTDYSQLKYPPLDIQHNLGYNRASLKGESVFYAGTGNLSAIMETRPGLGDLYTVSKWRQKKGKPLNHFPIFYHPEIYERAEFEKDWQQHTDFLNSLDGNVREVVSDFLSFLTEVFIKEVDREKKAGYIFSSLFANYFLTKASPQIHCIYYPSVASEYVASNIACLPQTLDDFFECVDVKECLCTHHNGAKQWLSRRLAEVNNVNANAIGKIEWQLHISESEYQELKKEYKFI